MNVIFVCTGNTCRSPMAEAILKDALKKQKIDEDIYVMSAGIFASDGEKMNPNAKIALEDAGIEAEEFRSRKLQREVFDKSDIIITMTENHKNMILSAYGHKNKKIYTLIELSALNSGEKHKGSNDISDPYGMSLEAYKNTYNQIRNEIEKILGYLKAEKQGENNENSNSM